MINAHPIQPVPPGERIIALDVLRGFAMFGVLIAYCIWSLGTAPEEQWLPLDRTLEEIASFAVDGKFYTILAFLFGLGFSLQLGRAGNSDVVPTYCRRLAILAAIGLLHALLLRNGDILLPYAITGFFLIPFRRSSDLVLLSAAFVCLLIPYAAHWLWDASGIPKPERPRLEQAPYLVENFAWVRYWFETAIFNWPTNLTLFLLGFTAGRHMAAAKQETRRSSLVGIAIAGAVAAGAFYTLNAQWAPVGRDTATARLVSSLLFTFHCWSLASAYAASLILALRSRTAARLVLPLASIGRMALTNYLAQAAVIVPLCLAFDLFDTFTPSRAIVLALTYFFLVQLPFSRWWLRRFQYGPAEWVWRRLTYGRVAGDAVDSKDYSPV